MIAYTPKATVQACLLYTSKIIKMYIFIVPSAKKTEKPLHVFTKNLGSTMPVSYTHLPVSCWEVDQEKDLVTIKDAAPFHEYTVSFFVYAIWDLSLIHIC